jgi:hypothetical protein
MVTLIDKLSKKLEEAVGEDLYAYTENFYKPLLDFIHH